MKKLLLSILLVTLIFCNVYAAEPTWGNIDHTRDVNTIMIGHSTYWYYEGYDTVQVVNENDTLIDTGALQVNWEDSYTGTSTPGDTTNRKHQRFGARNFWLWVLCVPVHAHVDSDSVAFEGAYLEYRLKSDDDSLYAVMGDSLSTFVESNATLHSMKWFWKYEPWEGEYADHQKWRIYNLYVPACSSFKVYLDFPSDIQDRYYCYWRVVGIW